MKIFRRSRFVDLACSRVRFDYGRMRQASAAILLLLSAPSAVAASDSGAIWLPYFLGEESVLPTYGASVAVDANGGMHAAYALYSGAAGQERPAIYAYCAGGCEDRANWTFTRIGEAVQEVRLELDPADRPRLMLFGPEEDPHTNNRMRYQYAECLGDSADAAQWKIITVATPIEAVALREFKNNRYFAIGPQGQAAFVYTDTPDNNHVGTFFVSCIRDCTEAANWTETTLTTEDVFDKPSLAFSREGRPRLAFGAHDWSSLDLYLAYAECSGDGANPDDWSATILTKIHGSAMYALHVDAEGKPRIAFSSGSYAAAPFADHQLYYLWCKEGAATDPANWSFNNVGLYLTLGAVDLALDSQDRPRLTYLTSQGLGFGWCNEDSESAAAKWQHRVVESNAALADNYEMLPIRRCTVSAWINGQRSRLALDNNGNPRVAYDAQHIWSGVYVEQPWESCYWKDATIARFAFFNLNVVPTVSIRRSGTGVEISFTGTLEWASDLNGPWTSVPSHSSPVRVEAQDASLFYRARD
jgi:hypothetical protein